MRLKKVSKLSSQKRKRSSQELTRLKKKLSKSKPNEVFEVRLDRMVTKWAGSIEIGVTTHAPGDLDFPSTMTNIRSGTWMMTGNGRLISVVDF